MRSERLKRLAFIGLAISGEILVACSDKGPTKAEVYQAFEQSRQNGLVIDPASQTRITTHDTLVEDGLRPGAPLQTVPPNIPHYDQTLIDSSISINPPSNLQLYNHPADEGEFIEFDDNVTIETEELHEFTSVNWGLLNLTDEFNVRKWEELILKYANKRQIPPEIIAVTIDNESHGRTDPGWDELPGDGAGLMGVMPNDENNTFPDRPDRTTLINNHEVNIALGTNIIAQIYNSESMGNKNWYLTFLWYNAGLINRLRYAIPYANNAYSKLGWEIDDMVAEKLLIIESGVYDQIE